MNTTQERNSNIEILRIISMFIIVLSHIAQVGYENGVALPYGPNQYFATMFFYGGGLGDVIFILISGYFMCTSRFTLRKFLKLVGEIWFYSAGIMTIYLVASKLGGYDTFAAIGLDFSVSTLLSSYLPIGNSRYWFATDYLILMVVSPLLNILLQQLDKRRLQVCLVLATLVWSIIAVFTNIKYDYTTLVWVFILYLYAGYVRLHVELQGGAWRNVLVGCLSEGIALLGACGIITAGWITGATSLTEHAIHFSNINSPFVLLASIEFLLAAIKAKPTYSRILNTISSTAFAVYLIHCGGHNITFLCKYVLGLPDSVGMAWWMPLHAIGVTFVIFAVCSVIDLVRQRTIERVYMNLVDRCLPGMQNTGAAIINRSIGVMERLLR